MALPTYAPKGIWHVGTLDLEDRNRPVGDLEGKGLSVSEHPEEWRSIARLGNAPTHRCTTGHEPRFLDALRLSDKQFSEIVEWGENAGYVSSTTTWRTTHYDDELDGTYYMEHGSRESALEELDLFEDEDPEDLLEEVRGYCATAKLEDYSQGIAGQSGTRHSLIGDMLCVAYADHLGFDGVWWKETLDPAALSAPRGVIIESRVSEWTFQSSDGNTSSPRTSSGRCVYCGRPLTAEESVSRGYGASCGRKNGA